jgi:hypothetical protein
MPEEHVLKEVLKSQYHAALAMLRSAVDECTERLWYDATPANAFWQLAYHTLFFAHLYLQRDEAAFAPWSKHQRDVQHPDGIPGKPDPDSTQPLLPAPYSKADVLEYATFCDAIVDEAVDGLDLESPTSGFRWYRMSKLEHQLVNLRHIQHHAAQLADRIRADRNVGIRWVGEGRRR